MALELQSSPALVVNASTGTTTTSAFSPPAGSLLVAMAYAIHDGAGSPSVSGGGLTWTRRVQRDAGGAYLEIWTAPCPFGVTNMTVTLSSSGVSGVFGSALKVDVYTGADLSTPVGATGQGSTSTNNATVNGFTSTVAGSRGCAVAIDFGFNPTPTSSDTGFPWSEAAGEIPGIIVRKAANTSNAGTNVTFNFDAGGSSSADWEWVAAEILPLLAVDGTAEPGTIQASVEMPTPTVSGGATVQPDTIAASAVLPVPDVSGGGTAHPGTVAAHVVMPTPTVTGDVGSVVVRPDAIQTELVIPPPTVTGQISAAALPGTVETGLVIPPPTVTGQRNATARPAPLLAGVVMERPVITVPVRPGDALDGGAGQIEWNGFVLGRGTPFRWLHLDGWRSKPALTSGNAPRASRHGATPGRPLAEERFITLAMLIRTPRGDIEGALQALDLATAVPDDEAEYPIVINDLGTPQVAWGRIDRLAVPEGPRIRLGHAPVTIQWVCSDPRRFGAAEVGVTLPLGTVTPIVNAGNEATHVRVRIPGPVDGPTLVNHTLGRTLKFAVTVDNGERLIIDTDAGLAYIGDTNIIGKRVNSVPVTDWVLGAGMNEIEFTADDGGSTADLFYRDAWL